jgi:hypothetical protein
MDIDLALPSGGAAVMPGKAAMKSLVSVAFAAFLGLGLAWVFTARESLAQRPVATDLSTELIALTTPIDAGRQQLTVIDQRNRVLSIYHLELATGAVTLKSVRNLSWDLQMDEFNGIKPLPREIRGMLQAR